MLDPDYLNIEILKGTRNGRKRKSKNYCLPILKILYQNQNYRRCSAPQNRTKRTVGSFEGDFVVDGLALHFRQYNVVVRYLVVTVTVILTAALHFEWSVRHLPEREKFKPQVSLLQINMTLPAVYHI